MHASIDRTDVGHAAAIGGSKAAARPPPLRSMTEVGRGVSKAWGRRACLPAAASIDHRSRGRRDLVGGGAGSAPLQRPLHGGEHRSIDRTDVGHEAAIAGGEAAARPPPLRSMAEVG